MRQEEQQEVVKSMRLGEGHAAFDEERFQVLLRRLLAMKADQIMVWSGGPRQIVCTFDVGLGFSDPAAGFLLHKALFPAS